MSNILDWAEREVAIACEKENSIKKDGEFDYGCACYESALKAFKSLCGDGHSGFSKFNFHFKQEVKTVEYSENGRLYCVNINNPNDTYSSGLVRRIIDKMFPITMPYIPGKPIKVYCEDFLTDKKNGDFDTIGVFYALKTENGEQKKIEINRFFREPKDNEKLIFGWVEISKDEYMQRKLESERAGGHTVLRGEQDY